jgi:L-asparaginase
MIDAAVAAGAQGLVSAGTGAGRPTPLEEAALLRARERGVVVVQASRVGSGRVAPLHFIPAGNLQPWKARLLLSLALTQTRDEAEIRRLFDAT